MFNLNTETDYALIILSYLYKKKGITALSELIKQTNLPQRYLARIAAKLVKQQLLISREGRVGGYQLASSVDKISLYDFLLVFEGDLFKTKCSTEDYCCEYEKVCHHKHFFTKKLNTILKNNLTKIRLIELFK